MIEFLFTGSMILLLYILVPPPGAETIKSLPSIFVLSIRADLGHSLPLTRSRPKLSDLEYVASLVEYSPFAGQIAFSMHKSDHSLYL